MTARGRGPTKPRRKAKRRKSTPSEPAPATSRRGPTRWRLWIFLSVSLGVALSIALMLFAWATRPGPDTTGRVAIELTGSEETSALAERLDELGLVTSPRLFALYVGVLAPGFRVAPGPHLLRGSLSPRELTQRLGRLPNRPRTRVTLPEGSNHFDIAGRLDEKEICRREDFQRAVNDRALLAELAIAGPSAEGYLFPATYELHVDADPKQVVRQLVAEMRKRIVRVTATPGDNSTERELSELELLTLASMIEKESRAADEQALVASVFTNRLTDPTFRPLKMLQSDPTAAYGCLIAPTAAPSCRSFTGKVTPELIRDAQNPYNTYRNPGLPPGPIANPGSGAILAALRPARTDYLYFVADGRGRHRFSKTFEDHRRAITGN